MMNDVINCSADGKYILAGGEDDLVQVWSMEERRVIAWGEGHNSWVSFYQKYINLAVISSTIRSLITLYWMLLAGKRRSF